MWYVRMVIFLVLSMLNFFSREILNLIGVERGYVSGGLFIFITSAMAVFAINFTRDVEAKGK